MKLKNILTIAVASGMIFASMDRTNVLGYTAGDYTDMNTYAHKAAGQNVAYTAGSDFAAVWTDEGTTWGFMSGTDSQLVNMLYSNGTYGLSVGLDMPTGGDTTFDLGFGMNLAGYDVGFSVDTRDGGPLSLNARGSLDVWAFDTATFSYHAANSVPGDATTGTDFTTIDAKLYGVNAWGPATGYFAMGVTSSDNPLYQVSDDSTTADVDESADGLGPATGWADPVTLFNTSFSVESTLTDWCDLRIGYTKSFNLSASDAVAAVGANPGSPAEDATTESYSVGLGFNYGSVNLDLSLNNGALDTMFDNPMGTVTGYNDDDWTQTWTLSYTW